MSHNLYIGALEPRSGKSLVLLGVMEHVSRRVGRFALFRPVVSDVAAPDNDLALIHRRYKLTCSVEAMYGVSHDEARQMAGDGEYKGLLKRIFGKYKDLERECDFVVCEGTDLTGLSSAFEFDFNVRIANELGCPMLPVMSGRNKNPQEILSLLRTSRELLRQERCTSPAMIVNRVEPSDIKELSNLVANDDSLAEPVYLVPEEPTLGKPTVGEVCDALEARYIAGSDEGLHREVLDCKVAAMQLPNFLPYVAEGSLIITPGDRADLILGSLAASFSETYPKIAGVILTGDMDPDPAVMRLIDGLARSSPPICSVASDTYSASLEINSVRAAIRPDNERKIATALGLFESCVNAAELSQCVALARSSRVTPIMFEYELVERAKAKKQHIVLPEGIDERILQAGEILLRREVVDLTFLGNQAAVRELATSLGLDLRGAHVVDPASSELREEYAEVYHRLRQHRGVTEEAARDAMLDVSYFGTMMVYQGAADGMVSGAMHTTAHTIRPGLEFIRTKPGCSVVSSVFFMCLADRVLVYGDCAVNPNPTPEQLADIAVSSASTAAMFGVEPRIAMLSYSTGASGGGEDVDRVREATRLAQELRPDLSIEGPIQYDAAIDPSVAVKKMPDSEVAGRATVFIFPDLNTGNNTYKAVQRAAGAVAVGPVLQGLNKPVNDLSRGCTVADIVNTVAITAIQAQADPDSP